MNELITLESKKKQIGYEIRQEQRNEHRRLYKEYRAMFRLMDIAVVLMILLSFGASFLTTMLAVEKKPEMIIVEANQVIAERGNYELSVDSTNQMRIFIILALVWSAILFVYVFFRMRIYKEWQLYLMLFCVLYYFIGCGSDFFNNFGYFVGKVLFGGTI